jgi:hypothetical protein
MMAKIVKIILLMFAMQLACSAHGAEVLPTVIKAFCDMAFAGDIAAKDQKFNATDVVEKGVPNRRILDYMVGDDYAYLWYEHGGRSYHQHLVKFSKTKPYEVKTSYVFDTTKHKDIQQLIKDTRFLSSHISNQCGL